jgi:hypothetical protein
MKTMTMLGKRSVDLSAAAQQVDAEIATTERATSNCTRREFGFGVIMVKEIGKCAVPKDRNGTLIIANQH